MTTVVEPCVWTIVIAAPCAWLTANVERSRFDRSTKVRQWREQTVAACMAATLPKGVTPVRLHAVVWYAGRRPVRDKLNLAPTIKACVDGLTPARTWVRAGQHHHTPGYGLLPDDSDRHVLETTWDLERLTPDSHRRIGYIKLTIREVVPDGQ